MEDAFPALVSNGRTKQCAHPCGDGHRQRSPEGDAPCADQNAGAADACRDGTQYREKNE